jgi:DNA-directed RNA polymerase subunit D
MDVVKLPIDGDENYEARFIVKNTFPAFANAIRRIIMLDVPTIAIEEVIMIENTTAIFDEYIAHRLGLIPLSSDVDDLNRIEDCDCEMNGCNMCTVGLSITQETDRVNSKMVYSRDLEPLDHRIYPIQEEIPIMKMGPDQRLILEAIARFGTGREHSKWIPAGTLGYQYLPVIDIKNDVTFEKDVADACPRNVFDFNDDKLTVKDLYNCNLCQLCVEKANESGGGVKVYGDDKHILFNIVGTGGLYIDQIVVKASEILDSKAEDFLTSLQEAIDELD